MDSGELVRIKQWGQKLSGEYNGTQFSGTVQSEGTSGTAHLSIPCVNGGQGVVASMVPGKKGSVIDINGIGAGRHQPQLVVICGPSGVGKGTLLAKLFKEYPNLFGFSVSHTTRQPRPGEVEGKDYFFAPKEEVQAGVDRGDFVEFAHVHGNIYGTSKMAVERVLSSGKACVLDIDIQGAQKVRASGIPFVGIFVKPPSWGELEKRLRGRGTEAEDKIQKRLQNARGEIEFCDQHDFFWYELVNDDLDKCYEELVGCMAQSMQLSGLPRSVDFWEDPAPGQVRAN